VGGWISAYLGGNIVTAGDKGHIQSSRIMGSCNKKRGRIVFNKRKGGEGPFPTVIQTGKLTSSEWGHTLWKTSGTALKGLQRRQPEKGMKGACKAWWGRNRQNDVSHPREKTDKRGGC